uniref:CCHC-type domain-containing protein n=1 Tax=Amphimedon queenslandica TaxID=400682 RepID=A0A1X7TB93_AMPQE
MWVLKLVPLLTGRALAAYANKDQEAAKDYGNVKKAILQRFDINEETYRQRFWTMKKAETQSYIELGVQLKDLFRKWTAVAKDNPEELAEIMVMEQLQNNMQGDLQVWIREKKTKTVVEAATQAGNYVLAPQGMRKEKKRCHRCQGLGHLYRDCPNWDRPKDKGEKPAKTDQRCFKCKNIGHVATSCKSAMSMGYFVEKWQQRRQRKTGEIVFWGSVQEEPVEMLVDTGCSYTLVHRRLVPD